MLQSTGSQTAGHDLVTEQKILKIKNQEEQKTLLKLKSNDDKLILTFFKCKYYKVMISFVVIGQEQTDEKQTKESEINPNTCGNVACDKSDLSNQ